MTINYNNIEYNYIWTPINFILPLSDEFYNKHYVIFYVFDGILVIGSNYAILLFDLTVITICICIECQFQYISSSYNTFVFAESPTKCKLSFNIFS